jgi:hypothetical protein
VSSNLDKPWDYFMLSWHISLDVILENPSLWSFDYISSRNDVTWDLVTLTPDIPWNYHILSSNPNITWDIIETNPNIRWNFGLLSLNPNITWDMVEATKHEMWCYDYLSKNKMSKHDIFQNRQLTYVLK